LFTKNRAKNNLEINPGFRSDILQNNRRDKEGSNSSTGRKTLYSVCGKWMNEYGALVE